MLNIVKYEDKLDIMPRYQPLRHRADCPQNPFGRRGEVGNLSFRPFLSKPFI